ncbi:hypothetical protein ACTFIY_012374 [Dictyostelium cf. discoideum]
MINLSSIGKNLTNIIFQNLGRDFHGNFPLILPSKMKSITYTDGFIQNLDLNEWISKYESFTNLNLANNKMNDQLGSIGKTSLTSLDLSNNSLTGIIDKTFCTINNLQLTNNNLSGEIPTYFGYNTSIIEIEIDGKKCLISKSTFYQIDCTIAKSSLPSNSDHVTIVTVGDLSTQITLIYNQVNTIIECPNGGSCNYEYGNGYCECNNVTGICYCNDIYSISPDCSPIECKDPLCGSNGICNTSIGSCEYNNDIYSWGVENCTTPLHFLSSIDSSTNNGGNVTFYGWFGNRHDNLTVSIGDKSCLPIYIVIDESILCYSPPGNGNQIVIINQNSIEWTSNSVLYQFKKVSLKCPNNCPSYSNGKCNTSTEYCKCFNNFGGAYCSSSNSISSNNNGENNDQSLLTENEPPKSVTIIDSETSSSTINNQKTSYQILIYSLVEIYYYGNQIISYSLESNWEKPIEINQSIYQFTQTIQNQQCTINYTIEEVKDNNGKQYSFADIDFTVDPGSIKMTIDITNYQYKSNLNTLQLLMKSSVQTIDLENDYNNNSCNDENTEIDTIGDDGNNNSLNYISIKKDSKVLFGRFIDRLISDDR